MNEAQDKKLTPLYLGGSVVGKVYNGMDPATPTPDQLTERAYSNIEELRATVEDREATIKALKLTINKERNDHYAERSAMEQVFKNRIRQIEDDCKRKLDENLKREINRCDRTVELMQEFDAVLHELAVVHNSFRKLTRGG